MNINHISSSSFGMLISERSSTFGSKAYRYGFNGMEGDGEVKGQGNSLDFGARVYDPRLVKWLSQDPLYRKAPDLTPYCYAFNAPLRFSDEGGEWPKLEGWYGITFFFAEGEVGAGLGYGLNYVRQEGWAEDEVGETHYVMESALYVTNQELEDGSRNPQVIAGASISLTLNVKQNWSAETFYGLLSSGGLGAGIPVGGDIGAGVGINVGFGDSEFTIGGGIGAGLKLSFVKTEVIWSISLTDAQGDKVDGLNDTVSDVWMVNNPTAIKDADGKVIGYQATVATKNSKGEKIDSGIKIYSDVVEDDEGKTSSTGVWMSKKYKAEAIKAEAEDKED